MIIQVGNTAQQDIGGHKRKHPPSLNAGRSEVVLPFPYGFSKAALCVEKSFPPRTVLGREMHQHWLLGLGSPAGSLCVTWHGDVLRQDGSKRTRAHCEGSKAKSASEDLWRILRESFPVFSFLVVFYLWGL